MGKKNLRKRKAKQNTVPTKTEVVAAKEEVTYRTISKKTAIIAIASIVFIVMLLFITPPPKSISENQKILDPSSNSVSKQSLIDVKGIDALPMQSGRLPMGASLQQQLPSAVQTAESLGSLKKLSPQ